MEYSKFLIYWFKKHHKLSIAKSVALLAVFEVEIGSVLCRNALWDCFGGRISTQFPTQPPNSQ